MDTAILPGPSVAEASSPRLLFASYHCYDDPSSGAALATRDLLELLVRRGWKVRVLCGPQLDFDRPESPRQWLNDQQITYQQQGQGVAASQSFSTVHYCRNDVPVAAYLPSSPSLKTRATAEGNGFLALLDHALDEFRPDVLLTYGGSWVGTQIQLRARRDGAKVVFALHNFAYRDASLFSNTDAVLVPSRYAAGWYRDHVGIRCTAVPSPLSLSRVACEPDPGQRYVTFVNPQPTKGVLVFARIAQELKPKRRQTNSEGRGRQRGRRAPWPKTCVSSFLRDRTLRLRRRKASKSSVRPASEVGQKAVGAGCLRSDRQAGITGAMLGATLTNAPSGMCSSNVASLPP